VTSAALGGRSWADPGQVSLHRLPMRVPFVAHPSAEGARGGDPDASPWLRRLDGRWRFQLVAAPELVTEELVAPATDDTGWAVIDVPGSWTLQGVGDHPWYTNIRMPWDASPPWVPPANPTGVHRTRFTVPAAWAGRRVVLHVGGAESVLYAFCNGVLAGSSTDSRLAAEMDLTPHLVAGENVLALVVVRWSAASYVEDQDQWWMAGLHREVLLRAEAPVHLADVEVDALVATEAPALAGTAAPARLRVRARVGAPPADPLPAGWSVRVTLEDLDGEPVVEPWTVPVAADRSPYVFRGHLAEVAADVGPVRPWSAEDPARYRVLLTLVDPAGTEVEHVAQLVGFRSVAVRDGLLQVNGVPLRIRGVNRHDHHPDRGRSLTAEDLRADLVAMKRANVNAVRTSHYPNDWRLLDLCDELGFYVVDEANLESHAFNDLLGDDPSYRATWVERVARMVQRDRNHPCVISWSLGNESGYGANHDAAAAWVRRRDPTRPLHYEGAIFRDWDAGTFASDLVCPMYAPVEAIVAWAERGPHARPLVLCEYSHAMGNSNGGLADYEAAFEAHEQLQGGFVWEWKDHGIRQVLADGRERFAYGGQFGDEPNDANFVADGIVAADLVPHPALHELTWCNRPVAVRLHDAATPDAVLLHVTNRRQFRELDDLVPTAEVVVDGVVRHTLLLALPPLPPGASVAVLVPVPETVGGERPGAEVRLRVHWRTAAATPWAEAGHEVAWDDVVVRQGSGPPEARVPGAAGSVRVEEGAVTGVVAGGAELLLEAPSLSLWRAPLDNDGLKLVEILGVGGTGRRRWDEQGVRTPARRLVSVEPEGAWMVRVEELVCTAGTVVHRQRIRPVTGGVEIESEVELPPALADVARVGHRMVVDPSLTTVRWLGRGPGENLPDRSAGSVVGEWAAPVEELPYVMPQSYGQRSDVRWWRLEDGAGRGLTVVLADHEVPAGLETHALVCSAIPHTDEQLEAARDVTELARAPGVVVHLDVAHRGTGTASCGPDTHVRHRLPAGTYRWRWLLLPSG
jgi:beta-galactosidase